MNLRDALDQAVAQYHGAMRARDAMMMALGHQLSGTFQIISQAECSVHLETGPVFGTHRVFFGMGPTSECDILMITHTEKRTRNLVLCSVRWLDDLISQAALGHYDEQWQKNAITWTSACLAIRDRATRPAGGQSAAEGRSAADPAPGPHSGRPDSSPNPE